MAEGPAEFSLLNDLVYHHLRRAIMDGTYGPDERIVELDIARKMKTSQGPVREALMRLEREGLVVRYQHRGTFVSPLPATETLPELFELRIHLEELAVRRLVTRIADEEVEQLRAHVEQMIGFARAGDIPRYFDADLEFHSMMFRFAGHELLERVWSVLAVQIRRLLPLTRQSYAARLEEVALEHAPLLDAIAARDFSRWQKVWRKRHMMFIWPDLGVQIDRERKESQG
jgi:DNA-binding GntR family transcriptional regulator